MKIIKLSPLFYPIFFLIPAFLYANVGGASGSNIFTIAEGNYSDPTYKIVSAASLGDPVFFWFGIFFFQLG